MIDYICISGSLQDRIAEYADHLHEHFVHPVEMREGRYMPPAAPGYGAEMKTESMNTFEYSPGH